MGSAERAAIRFGKVIEAARSLRDEASFLGLEIDHALIERVIVGTELGALETHQQLVLGHMIAIAHQDLRDDAAVKMLDSLDMAARLDDARCHGGAGEGCETRP